MNDDNYPLLVLINPTPKEMDSQNNLGQTTLHISLINKNYQISRYLIENGANVNLSDNNLNTSLHLAVKNGAVDIIQLLIEHQANPILLNKNNETVLDIAVKLNNKECINILKDISLMNQANNNSFKIKTSIINGNKNNNNIDRSNNIIINSNNISNKNKINIPKKKINSSSNNNSNTLIPKYNNKKYNMYNLNTSNNEGRTNIFFANTNPKNRHRTNSTSILDISITNKNIKDQIYTKKIVLRSQSGRGKSIKKLETEMAKEKKQNIISNLFSPSVQNNIPRKTDFILQNEIFLDNDNDNESIEEEESIIRENIKPKQEETNNIVQNGQIEKKTEKIIESFTSLKTIKVTPLTETNNKINPFLQIDSFVSAIHKNDQGISESNGYINEDGLIIVEPSIDITNNNSNNNIIDNKPMQKKEQIINKINNNKKDTKEDLVNFLKRIEMDQYSDLLIKEGFDDINLVINQMKKGNPINDDILREIGIPRPGDRAKILIRIQECAHLFDFKIPFEAVYYINRKKYEFLKYDFHVKALQNWLKKLRLQNYLENFYNNGYYSPELVFIQKASKFPINDTILERDLKIDNINDRKLIMSSISSNSNNYVSELRKKNVKKKNEDNPENKEQDDNKCMIF
jgi:ankyrin repeat protein